MGFGVGRREDRVEDGCQINRIDGRGKGRRNNRAGLRQASLLLLQRSAP